MLNSTNETNIKLNAVNGAILKNHPESWFERFHLKSKRADALLNSGNKNTVVLQMVICGDMEVIAECVSKEKFNENLKGGAE